MTRLVGSVKGDEGEERTAVFKGFNDFIAKRGVVVADFFHADVVFNRALSLWAAS